MLALAAQGLGRHGPGRARVEHAHIGQPAHRQPAHAALALAQGGAQHIRRPVGDHGQRPLQVHATVLTPFERQAQEQLDARCAGFTFGKRQRLGIFVHGRVVRHQGVNGAVHQARAQGIPVALLAQGRIQAGAAVKVTNVGIGQVQRVDADVTRDIQAIELGLAHQRHAGGAAEPTQMHPGTGDPHQLKNDVQGNGFSRYRHATQAQPRGQRATGRHTAAQKILLRAQPDRVTKGAGVLKCPLHHLGVGQGHLGLAEGNTARLGQLQHLGQGFAFELAGQCPQRVDMALVELFGPKAQHLDQTRLIEHGVGVRRAHQAGHPAGHGGGHLGFEHAGVFQARLTQAHRQIQQTRDDQAAGRVNRLLGLEARRHRTNGENFSIGNGHIGQRIHVAGGIYDAAALDQDVHAVTSFMELGCDTMCCRASIRASHCACVPTLMRKWLAVRPLAK